MLCQRGIMLAAGFIEKMGDAATVMDYYRASQVLRMELSSEKKPEMIEAKPLLEARASKVVLASKSTGIISVDIIADNNPIHSGDRISIRITAIFLEHYCDPHIGFGIRNKMGIVIYEANTYTLKHKTRPVLPRSSSGTSGFLF